MANIYLFLLNQPDTRDNGDDGIWKPRMMPNPESKGPWKHKV
jgi:calreticulin